MRFNPKARLDTGKIGDSGGGLGGGGMGPMGGGTQRMPLPGSVTGGGGMSGLIITILFIVLASCLNGGGGLPTGGAGANTGGMGTDTSQMNDADSDRYANCKTGADANNDDDCKRVAVENSLRSYWSQALPQQAGIKFAPATIQTFTGSISTGCGEATSQVGPFYCPPDQGIYLDTSFFEQVLQGQLGGPAGDFVEPYVIGHEYGHHIQNLMGTMGKVRTQQGPRSDAVRLELQADCYAGMWVKNATATTDQGGQELITDITEQDMAEAIAAASAVGDDAIQQKTQGQVTEETWTHGSSESRMRWFKTGLSEGTLEACDTWAVQTP